MELGEPDASGRRAPVVKKDSEFVLDVDCVIMSGAKVLAGAQVFKTIIGEGAVIGEGCVVGVGGGEEGTSKYVSPYCSGGVSLVAPGARVTEKWIVSNSMITDDKGGKQ